MLRIIDDILNNTFQGDNFKMNKKNRIVVTVICLTYNHEKYIADALEGFIAQKTNFEFEIFVHDDASTDRTADIIREYANKYPNLIRPILQTENQYFKGGSIKEKYIMPYISGEFIALCEGDDYWTDPYKLQKQYDILMKHPKINICAHKAYKVDANSKKILGYIAPADENRIFSVEDVILGGGGFVATNSLMYRRKINNNMYEFRKQCGLDYALQIEGALSAGMLYLCDCMSAYRYMTPNSWSDRVKKSSISYNKNNDNIVKMLKTLNNETNHEYEDCIHRAILENEFAKAEFNRNYNEMLSSKYYDIWAELSLMRKIRIIIKKNLKKFGLIKKCDC